MLKRDPEEDHLHPNHQQRLYQQARIVARAGPIEDPDGRLQVSLGQ